MTVTAVYDMNKKKVGDVELPDDVFNVEVNSALLHQMVTAHLANARQGTVKTKTRAEVRGGGRKPYKQKGTGQARHGSNRSPTFVGGGAPFGPKPRDWSVPIPKKQRRAALKMALTQKNKDGTLFVLDSFSSKDGKTAKMVKTLAHWDGKSRVVVIDKTDEKTVLATRNIPYIKIVKDKELSVLDLFKYEHLLLTKDSIGNLVSRVSR